MYRITKLKLFLACIAIMLTVSNAFAKKLEDKNWIEVQTRNFQIRSILSEKKTIELATYLETFRNVITVVSNIENVDPVIPTRIYALDNGRDFDKLDIDRNILGYFSPGLRQNLVLVRDSKIDAHSIILHEYVHYLMRNKSLLTYPRWFDEGMAEYFAATVIDKDSIRIGSIPTERITTLRRVDWINIREIINPEQYEKWPSNKKAMFYSEAWMLAHYLQTDPEWQPRFSTSMTQYLKSLESGEDDIEAFEKAFDTSTTRLNKKLLAFINRGKIPALVLGTDQFVPDKKPVVVKLDRAEAALGLAEIALRSNNLEQARNWFKIAAMDPDKQASAEAGIGDTWKFDDKFEQALPHFEKAIALAPDDPNCQLDIAEFWHDRAEKSDDPELLRSYLDRAREHYVLAWKLDKSKPETYAMYGASFLLGDAQVDKAIDMLEEAEYLLPSYLGIRLDLAEAYALKGRNADATRAARSVLAWVHDESKAADKAREILAGLGARH